MPPLESANPPKPRYAPKTKPPFTTRSRVLCVIALAATAGAMYAVIATDEISGRMKPLVCGGVLMAGVLVIAAGAHFADGRHRR
jgi:hypothetical protein